MKAYILALVPNWADADDLYQETTVRLWEQFADYDPEQEFGAWACTIAHYMVLAHRKKSSREKGRFSQAFVDAVAEEVAATSHEADLRYHALQHCLRKLSERNRDLIRRCYSGTNTLKAVAEQMGAVLTHSTKHCRASATPCTNVLRRTCRRRVRYDR